MTTRDPLGRRASVMDVGDSFAGCPNTSGRSSGVAPRAAPRDRDHPHEWRLVALCGVQRERHALRAALGRLGAVHLGGSWAERGPISTGWSFRSEPPRARSSTGNRHRSATGSSLRAVCTHALWDSPHWVPRPPATRASRFSARPSGPITSSRASTDTGPWLRTRTQQNVIRWDALARVSVHWSETGDRGSGATRSSCASAGRSAVMPLGSRDAHLCGERLRVRRDQCHQGDPRFVYEHQLESASLEHTLRIRTDFQHSRSRGLPMEFVRSTAVPQLRAVGEGEHPAVGERDHERRSGQTCRRVVRHQKLPCLALPPPMHALAKSRLCEAMLR